MIRILGLDVGEVRIGVALSDPLGYTAQPLEVINRKKDKAMERICALVTAHEVQHVVVGFPLQLNGQEGLAAESIQSFTTHLKGRLDIPVTLWDERLSTAQAQRSLIEQGMRRSRRKDTVDKIAAALILQSYLDAKENA
jgi:putative holliday junction resolvase